MEHHPRVLELRVQPVAVERRVRQPVEGIRLPEQHH